MITKSEQFRHAAQMLLLISKNKWTPWKIKVRVLYFYSENCDVTLGTKCGALPFCDPFAASFRQYFFRLIEVWTLFMVSVDNSHRIWQLWCEINWFWIVLAVDVENILQYIIVLYSWKTLVEIHKCTFGWSNSMAFQCSITITSQVK